MILFLSLSYAGMSFGIRIVGAGGVASRPAGGLFQMLLVLEMLLVLLLMLETMQ